MLKLRAYDPLNPEEGKEILGWLKDEYHFRLWSADKYSHYPISAGEMNAFYREKAKSEQLKAFTVYDDGGRKGHFTLRCPENKEAEWRMGFIVINSAFRGKGLGREMLRLGTSYAFEKLGAEKVTLGVFEQNEGARRCYTACGFRETGMPPDEILLMGQLWRCIDMVLYRDSAKEKI